jgi:amidase
MNWLKDSIMMTQGVGKNSEGKTHHLTEKVQGTYQYTMGPYSEPVMHIKPGDTVVVETRDAFEGKIQSENDKPSEKLRMPFLNPQNGPIMIEGAV